jgi:hypothetical protein
MVSVSGNLIGSQASGKTPLPPKAELEWWYQYYFATDRGHAGYELRTAVDLATLLSAQGLRERARALLQPVAEQFVEGSDTADLKAAERLLAILA